MSAPTGLPGSAQLLHALAFAWHPIGAVWPWFAVTSSAAVPRHVYDLIPLDTPDIPAGDPSQPAALLGQAPGCSGRGLLTISPATAAP